MRLALLVVLSLGCGGPKPQVAPAPKVTERCAPLEPGAGEAPNLKRLLPSVKRPRITSVEQLLRLRGVPTDAQWAALPAEADAALMKIARDEEAPATQRARAMSGLGIRAPEGAAEVLAGILEDEQANPTLRRTAASALTEGRLLEAPEALPALTKGLASKDAALRGRVIKALGPHRARPEIKARLEARRAVETDPHLKAQLAEPTPKATPSD